MSTLNSSEVVPHLAPKKFEKKKLSECTQNAFWGIGGVGWGIGGYVLDGGYHPLETSPVDTNSH